MSNRRKLRQCNGGKLTRDRTEWTSKIRLGHGAHAYKSVASHNRVAERDRLTGVAARQLPNGVQSVQGGLTVHLEIRPPARAGLDTARAGLSR